MKKINLPLVIGLVILTVVLAGLAYYFFVYKDQQATTSKTCTTYGNRVEEQCVEDYIGLTLQEAVARAKKYQYVPVPFSIDGEGQNVAISGSTPIYFVINNGVVTDGYFEDGVPAR